MKFNYQTRTKKGEIRSGQVEASSREAAASFLQKHGLYVTFLEEAIPPIYARRIKFFEKISQKDLVLFSRQLAIMFKSKVPLVESLRVLSQQTDNPDFKEKIMKISEEVEGGTALSNALENFPEVFSSFYIAMVKSGEVSGKLSEVLNYLADHLERKYHLTAKTKGALLYPSLIVFVVILVLLLMIFFVIPQLAEVLTTEKEALPWITMFVINSSAFVRDWGWALFIILVLFVAGFLKYYRTDRGQRFFDREFVKFPLLGPFFKMINVARFAENLSTLISGGLPIAQALETVGDIISNTAYKEVIFKMRDEVRKGVPISAVLSRNPDLFPPVFIQMVLVGEKTGTLDSTLMNIVDFYQKEIDRMIDNALSILEPVLVLVLGLVVAGLMLSILMPLYKMIAL